MVNLLPAVLIGGPPHAGKSVLFYGLTHALHERGVRHHAIRACPDGEGNWYQELDLAHFDQETISHIRHPGKWTTEFVARISADLERRNLPLLVDMGGRPTEAQYVILRQCTHSLLLLRADSKEEEQSKNWQHYVQINGLLPLATLYSERTGPSRLTATLPVIEGTISGLERHNRFATEGSVFNALVDRLAALFTSYSDADREKVLLDQAPTELVINLYKALEAINPQAKFWERTMLPSFLASLPAETPLSVYGKAPHWLYSALSVHGGQQSFYQFDPRLGWIEPLALKIDGSTCDDLHIRLIEKEDYTILSVDIPDKHLDYFQQDALPVPAVPAGRGLILDGAMPSWLVTGLTRLYLRQRVTWIACHQPPLGGAVVVSSRVPIWTPGDLMPFSLSTS